MHALGTALILHGGVGPEFTASGVAIDAYMAGKIRDISLDRLHCIIHRIYARYRQADPKYISNGFQVTAQQTTTSGTKESVGNKYTRATEAGHSTGGREGVTCKW